MKLTACLLLFSLSVSAQSPLLVSGPMLCHVSEREATVWIEVSPQVSDAEIRWWKKDEVAAEKSSAHISSPQQEFNPLKWKLSGLAPGKEYLYEILLDGKQQSIPYPLQFRTQPSKEPGNAPKDFSFALGSCAFINDSLFDRPGKPYGRHPRIFDSMANNPSDFMIWCGDNVYTRADEFNSTRGFYYRYSHDRSIPQLQKLLASRPHYAIWDDHDYGPNNVGAGYKLKDTSLKAFKDYWGNPGYGEPGNPGVYTKFTWSDCEFFLTDDRYYRSKESLDSLSDEKHFFGTKQLEWLKSGLSQSTASFKFVVVGSQSLNPLNNYENFRHYKREYDKLIGFIAKNKIRNVVFLTGDRHYSDILRIQPEEGLSIFDITSSALTSSSYPETKQTPEGTNPLRVVPDMVFEQNYIKLEVKGGRPAGRELHVTCITVDNQVAWNLVIKAQ